MPCACFFLAVYARSNTDSGLSGQVFYDYVNSTMWALLYTSLPIVLLGVYDMDVLPATVLRYPWLYRNGVDDELLTKSFFWGWIAQVRGVFGREGGVGGSMVLKGWSGVGEVG